MPEAKKAANFLDAMPADLRPSTQPQVEAEGGYAHVALGSGLAKQVLEHLAASGQKPGKYTAKARGNSRTGRTTAGYRFDVDVAIGQDTSGNPIVVEVRGVAKWRV